MWRCADVWNRELSGTYGFGWGYRGASHTGFSYTWIRLLSGRLWVNSRQVWPRLMCFDWMIIRPLDFFYTLEAELIWQGLQCSFTVVRWRKCETDEGSLQWGFLSALIKSACRESSAPRSLRHLHIKRKWHWTRGYPLAEEFYTKITGFHLAVMTYRLSIPKRPSPCHSKAQSQVKQRVNQLKVLLSNSIRPFCDVMAGEHSCAAL